MRKITENKKGWIKILEAFLAIAFIMGILTILSFNNNKVVENKFSSRVEEMQTETLHVIQTNNNLRQEILESPSIPMQSNETDFPPNTNSTVANLIPSNLECFMKICLAESICGLNEFPENKEIYVESVIISSSHNIYNPTKLAMFCWRK